MQYQAVQPESRGPFRAQTLVLLFKRFEVSRQVPAVQADCVHSCAELVVRLMQLLPSIFKGSLVQVPTPSQNWGLQYEPTGPDAAELHGTPEATPLTFMTQLPEEHTRFWHTFAVMPVQVPVVLNEVEQVPLCAVALHLSVKHDASLEEKPETQPPDFTLRVHAPVPETVEHNLLVHWLSRVGEMLPTQLPPVCAA